ncbi:MAG: Phosphoribosylanthranilate isomerase [uncultured Sphingomonadaceae bacterium]|uniref:N-(5'-phosphoribosyl)anthranilate isomerase n=1 Tax=uncultured Sphingomonadaceae bacterium TaxID=169976 RepID=A0A6J4SUY2_9SPHN|nr:MAG: Phosphoribosylanthranilate isomerase [uncultured Sphingomonadaceae bacterium]
MLVQAKICGVSTPEALDAAVTGGASHVGFVHFAASPRHLASDRMAALARRLPDRVGAVLVLVDANDGLVDELVRAVRPRALQLHSAETPAHAAALRARHGVEVWKALPVRTRADLASALAFRGAADRLVYDAKPPAGAALPGGMGLRFDWALLEGFAHPLPWALSGGLDPGNIADAVGRTGARLVDVSSGVESAPGVKDVDKIARFLQSVARL